MRVAFRLGKLLEVGMLVGDPLQALAWGNCSLPQLLETAVSSIYEKLSYFSYALGIRTPLHSPATLYEFFLSLTNLSSGALWATMLMRNAQGVDA